MKKGTVILKRNDVEYSRNQVIELLFNSTTFKLGTLNKMLNEELVVLWDDFEIDELIEENLY